MSNLKKKVLITPLDWGLGHATRCIPIILELISQGCEVQVASSGDALKLLRLEFPTLKFHLLVSYNPKYSSSLSFAVKIILQLPKFARVIRKEKKEVARIVLNEKIDIIISDNRYGCRNLTVKSIFITHQVNILLPWKWMEGLVNYLHHRQIRKFDECWVPDFENGITGKLTSVHRLRLRFLGMISRMKEIQAMTKYEIAVIISGPEPQRSFFENIIRQQLENSGLNYFLVRGDFGSSFDLRENEANHLLSEKLNELLASSELIVCRSGYSSVMDLWKLKKKVIFVPTPGQTEQEYLASELKRREIAGFQSQNELNLVWAVEMSKNYSGFAGIVSPDNLLQIAITDLLNFKHV